MKSHDVSLPLCGRTALAALAAAMLIGGTTPRMGAQEPAAAPAAPAPGTVVGEPAHDPVKGAAILAEVRTALGGEARFAAVQNLEVKGKSARAMGSGILEGDFEYQISMPDKFRRKEALSANGGEFAINFTMVLNGQDVLEDSAMGGSRNQNIDNFDSGRGNRGGGPANISAALSGVQLPANATPEEQQDAQRRAMGAEMERLLMAVLLTSPAPVEWLGTAESPDGTADVLQFHTPDDVATRLLVDTKTRMPLMLTWTGIAPQLGNFGNRGGRGGRGNQGGRGRGNVNTPTTLTMYLSDYKNVNGVRLPHLIQRGPNGETTEEYVVKNYKINQTFKAEMFRATR